MRHDRAHRPALSIHLQRASRTDEEDAPVLELVLAGRIHVDLRVGEGHDEVVVLPRDRKRVLHLLGVRIRHGEERAGRRRPDRHFAVGIHEPVGDVDVMRAPVGDEAAAVVVPAAPGQPAWLERLSWRRPLESFPVQPRGNRLLRFLRPRVRPGLDDDDMGDRAERAAVEIRLGVLEMIPASLLRADLHDLLAFLIRGEHRIDPGDRVGGRLLDVDVLPGGHGIDHLLAVPVIRGGNQHRVDVAAIENTAIVSVDLKVEGLACRRHPRIELRLVDFGSRQELAIGVARERVEDASAAVAGANDAHADPVIRALHAVAHQGLRGGRCQRRRGHL